MTELQEMLELARKGIDEIMEGQRKAFAEI
jgi:ribonuclease PH